MKREVAIVMGSISDWNTMKEAAEILENFGVKSFLTRLTFSDSFVTLTPDMIFSTGRRAG